MTSRQHFEQYLQRLRERSRRNGHVGGGGVHGPGAGAARHRRRRSRPFLALLGGFWRMLRGHRLVTCLALGTLSIATIVGLAMPASTKIAIDYILTGNPGPEGLPAWVPYAHGAGARPKMLLVLLSAAMIGVTVVSIALRVWGRWQATRITKRLQAHMRRRVFDHVVRLPLHRIHQLKSGGVAGILREDAGGAAELMFSLIYNPWRAIIQLVGTVVILAAVDWRLLLGCVALIPTIWLTHRTWIGRIRPVYRDIRESRSRVDAQSTEAFGGMRVVRGFGREAGEAARYIRGTHFMIRQEILAWWWARGVEIAWQILIPVASSAVLLYGGSRVIDGTLTIGDVMMFSAYLLMLLGPLEALVSSATNMQNSLSGFDRVLDLLDEPREFEASRGGIEVSPPTCRGRITIDDAWFTYPGSAVPVIRGVSLEAEPGQTIALVGPSGAGKTTLCNLVARFYDPTRGSILLDGTDLRRIDVDAYRRLLGIVEQDVFLFDGTVKENIAFARRGATEQQVYAAARVANADAFIESFPDGYETIIGERGVRLSGGQKQRIAIARAVLADPRILILDEATSNLDSESEGLIQQGLSRLMRGRTSFVIAHRLSTIRHADRIAVIEDGRIIETGSHEALLDRDGRYAQFLRLQIQQATS